ncbi:hypothetical protein BUE80_DR011872 [Diplocarpon rosae]|nr:hypothetical protein BUE80_DR011872 [Diplocarpon rosae]WRW55983.1 secreted effector protein 43 [Diplocarpon rosae]
MKFTLVVILAQAMAASALYCSGPFTVGGGDYCQSGSGQCCSSSKKGAFTKELSCQSVKGPEGENIKPNCDGGC